MKRTDLNALLSFFVILRFSAIQNLLSDLSLSEFPFRKKSKSYILDFEVAPARSKKKYLEHASCPNSSTESWYRVKRSVPVNVQVKFISTAHAVSSGVLVY